VHEELGGRGFTVITVALDKSADDARPWIEAAKPAAPGAMHPALVDTRHLLADLYNIVNVPTVFWIDEAGRIVRPNDVAFGTDTFKHITGLESARHLAALRAWVKGDASALPAGMSARELQPLPSADDQQARAEFGLGEWLYRAGRAEAAARHFARGGELAPHDFTIRRGTMPMRGVDPMGPEFRAMLGDWVGKGNPYYKPLADTKGSAEW
jgi:hypothetical protein